jgi:hypothetical protein
MELTKFQDLMDTYNVAFIYYKTLEGKTTFVVGTTDFDDPYIQGKKQENITKFGSPYPPVDSNQVLIFSYSKDKFRVLNLRSIINIASMESVLNVPTRHTRSGRSRLQNNS